MSPSERLRSVLRSRLPTGQRFVLVAVVDHLGHDEGEAWPSQATIAALTGLGERTVRRALADLAAAGILLEHRTPGRASRWSVAWQALADYAPPPPQDVPELSTAPAMVARVDGDDPGHCGQGPGHGGQGTPAMVARALAMVADEVDQEVDHPEVDQEVDHHAQAHATPTDTNEGQGLSTAGQGLSAAVDGIWDRLQEVRLVAEPGKRRQAITDQRRQAMRSAIKQLRAAGVDDPAEALVLAARWLYGARQGDPGWWSAKGAREAGGLLTLLRPSHVVAYCEHAAEWQPPMAPAAAGLPDVQPWLALLALDGPIEVGLSRALQGNPAPDEVLAALALAREAAWQAEREEHLTQAGHFLEEPEEVQQLARHFLREAHPLLTTDAIARAAVTGGRVRPTVVLDGAEERMAAENTVLVSELAAPPGWRVVWERSRSGNHRGMGANAGGGVRRDTERLYALETAVPPLTLARALGVP